MKIRIKGASVRIRLTKSEVAQLVAGTKISDYTPFPVGAFRYAVRPVEGDALTASFDEGEIALLAPMSLLQGWDGDDRISLEAHMPLNDSESLHLLLEKDFKCLDIREEEQGDYYDNPAESC